MINQLLLLGIIKDLSKLDEGEIVLEVKRNYKNTEGVFLKDNFKCKLWITISKKMGLNCKVGDLVAVKGRLVEDNGNCNVLAEQVILLNKVSETLQR